VHDELDQALPNAKRTYKDTVFKDLFGSNERKQYALSLYNALNGSHYDNPSDIEINTLEDVIYLGVRNDVSFLIHSEMVLWEQQSTYNPNMPLRGFMYFARLYRRWLKQHPQINIYGSKTVILPCPRCVVFYVGENRRFEAETLLLSSAFEHNEGAVGREPALEVRATVYNVNEGHNTQLSGACEALAGYAHFIALAREERDNGAEMSEAVDRAVLRCIDEGVLDDYLSERRAEVVDMFLTEYDEDRVHELFKEEGREEGREEMLDEMHRRAADAVRAGLLELHQAAVAFGLDEERILELV